VRGTRDEGIEPPTLVDNVEYYLALFHFQRYGRTRGATVFDDIVERFLDYPVQAERDVVREPRRDLRACPTTSATGNSKRVSAG